MEVKQQVYYDKIEFSSALTALVGKLIVYRELKSEHFSPLTSSDVWQIIFATESCTPEPSDIGFVAEQRRTSNYQITFTASIKSILGSKSLDLKNVRAYFIVQLPNNCTEIAEIDYKRDVFGNYLGQQSSVDESVVGGRPALAAGVASPAPRGYKVAAKQCAMTTTIDDKVLSCQRTFICATQSLYRSLCRANVTLSLSFIYKPADVQLPRPSSAGPSLADDLRELLDSSKFRETITLIAADGQKIAVNKLFLIARSDVFASLFKSREQSKSNDDVLELREFAAQTLSAAIEFMKTDKVSEQELQSTAKELILFADKYDIQKLKLICEQHLVKNITSANQKEISAILRRVL